MIKIGKGTSEKERNDFLVKEYRDVFSFSYDELKAYREDVFQHTIPLKQDVREVKPFLAKTKTNKPQVSPYS